jgi:predicted nucleotidyltransferase
MACARVFLENRAMRLNQDQVQAIKRTAQTVLGDGARVTLFGSRTDDSRRGGDIDLLFEAPSRLDNKVAVQGQLYVALIRQLGDRKIDVLLKDPSTPEAPVMRTAREKGILL